MKYPAEYPAEAIWFRDLGGDVVEAHDIDIAGLLLCWNGGWSRWSYSLEPLTPAAEEFLRLAGRG